MKTESEKIEISKQAAEILETWASRQSSPVEELGLMERGAANPSIVLLVDDHGACAEIAADNDFDIFRYSDGVGTHTKGSRLYIQYYSDFPSRIEATSWAICEAVIEQSKESGK